MRRRPRLAARDVADVTERAGVVTCRVLAPACDGEVVPAAVAAPGIADHHVIAAIRQKLHFGYRRIGRGDDAHRHLRRRRGRADIGERRRLLEVRGDLGQPFLQQQHRRQELRVGREPALHRSTAQQIGEREHAHALVVRHERADRYRRLRARQPRRRVIDRFVKTVAAFGADRRQPLQVHRRRLGRDHQGHHRCVRRNDDIVAQSAFQPDAGDAERAVLVVERRVDRVIAGLRHPPRNVAFGAVSNLPRDRCVIGLVEQRVSVSRHHQQRHQVLEHRAAPR